MKPRIIPTALISSGTNVVTSQQFSPWRTIASLAQHLELQVVRNADEIHVIDITASQTKRTISKRSLHLVQQIVDIPIALGGGIKNVEQAKMLIQGGADKVILGSLFIDNPDEITNIVNTLGSQSVSLRIDYKYDAKSKNRFLYDYRTGISSLTSLEDAVSYAFSLGVGELTLTCVDKDGLLGGLDLDLLTKINLQLLPIIISGGASSPDDFAEAIILGSSGVSASSIFAYTEYTPQGIREYLRQEFKIPMRII